MRKETIYLHLKDEKFYKSTTNFKTNIYYLLKPDFYETQSTLKHGILFSKPQNFLSLNEILNKIEKTDFRKLHCEDQIELKGDYWLEFDFDIDEVTTIQGGSVNTGFGIEHELLKEVTYDVYFDLCNETNESIRLPKSWNEAIRNSLLINYK